MKGNLELIKSLTPRPSLMKKSDTEEIDQNSK